MAFTRTITKTTIFATATTEINGKLETRELIAFEVNGKPDKEKAVSLAQKKYKKEHKNCIISVRDMKVREAKYSISDEDFFKYAVPVPAFSEQEKEDIKERFTMPEELKDNENN